MAQVRDLSLNLSMTTILCKNARRRLLSAKDELTQGSLVIIQKERKLQGLQQVVSNLLAIKDLSKTERNIQETLNMGDFPRAITLCLECRDALAQFKRFNCVNELTVVLQVQSCHAQRNIGGALIRHAVVLNNVVQSRRTIP